jgi:hypothetical protein
MKFLSPILPILVICILAGCGSEKSDDNIFTKQVDVFGIHIYATDMVK